MQHKLKLDVTTAELDEFFKVAKTDSSDKDPDRITAVEYYLNVHSYPAFPPMKSAIATRIASLKPETEAHLADWVKRLGLVFEAIKRANVRREARCRPIA